MPLILRDDERAPRTRRKKGEPVPFVPITVPSSIEGEYYDDYDLMYVDKAIKSKLYIESQEQNLQMLYIERETLIRGLSEPKPYTQLCEDNAKLRELTEKIIGIETGSVIKMYQESTAPLMEIYLKCKGKYEESEMRQKVIEKFFGIARQYIPIRVVKKVRELPGSTQCCIECGCDISQLEPSEIGITCSWCGTENPELHLSHSDKDSGRVNAANVVEDESVNNFMKEFVAYQGKQPKPPPDWLFDELDSYFASIGRPSKEEIRKMPLGPGGYRGDTCPSLLWETLKHIKRTEYNKDYNYIGKKYWGWHLHDLSHLGGKIREHYLATQAAYNRIPESERGRHSSLGTQFRLRAHLLLLNHDCLDEEFKIAKNPDSVESHRLLWKRMCEEAQHPEIYYLDI
jgi:hypothetical protein